MVMTPEIAEFVNATVEDMACGTYADFIDQEEFEDQHPTEKWADWKDKPLFGKERPRW